MWLIWQGKADSCFIHRCTRGCSFGPRSHLGKCYFGVIKRNPYRQWYDSSQQRGKCDISRQPPVTSASLFHCRKGKLFRPFQAVFLGAESQAARVVTCSKLRTLKQVSCSQQKDTTWYKRTWKFALEKTQLSTLSSQFFTYVSRRPLIDHPETKKLAVESYHPGMASGHWIAPSGWRAINSLSLTSSELQTLSVWSWQKSSRLQDQVRKNFNDFDGFWIPKKWLQGNLSDGLKPPVLWWVWWHRWQRSIRIEIFILEETTTWEDYANVRQANRIPTMMI